MRNLYSDEYDGATEIPTEIRTVQDAYWLGLSIAQWGMVAVSLIVAYLSYKLTAWMGSTLQLCAALLFSVPIIACTFVRINGLSLVDFLLILYSNHLAAFSFRTNKQENLYEALEKMGVAPQKGKKKVSSKTKTKKHTKSIHVMFK